MDDELMMENPIQMDDSGEAPFMEPPKWEEWIHRLQGLHSPGDLEGEVSSLLETLGKLVMLNSFVRHLSWG